ncbi:hypothetical protein E6P07_07465 [Thermochromatium tepidum ATCC 43061]|uniref:PilZ domain-containing protein n=2 Tax=Thermochromatium tepidum TaxID=1050 RepID=A0A6I6E851_THETI|nr:hypothetical protein E6P07_07465 [Thermochromatium tepidum ATCC 43061]
MHDSKLTQSAIDMLEKRSQRRVGLEIPIKVCRPGSNTAITAHYQDLSWAGASFITNDISIQPGDRLILYFPWTNRQSFTIEADVMRCETLEAERHRVAVRFTTVGHQDNQRLTKLIELLSSGQPEVSQGTPPFVPTLELVFDDQEEMRQKLSEIALGGVSITAFGAYQIGQSLLLSVGYPDDFQTLRLRARVKSQSIEDPGDSLRPCLVTLELAFEHPLDELQRLTQRHMRLERK